MLKIVSNWRNTSLKFPFDKSSYAKLQTHHERSNYAGSTIQKFATSNSNISNLLKTSISQQVQTNIEQFLPILSEYIDNIITNTNYLNYVKFLTVVSTFMESLPRVEKYSNFADLICHFCFNKENQSEQQYFIATLHFLFLQQKFCDTLIQNAQMQSLILNLLKGTAAEITSYCEKILTPQLVISLMNKSTKKGEQRTDMCAENFIPKLFEFTISQRAQISSVIALILFLAKLAFKICEQYQKDILELQSSSSDEENNDTDKECLINELKSQNQTLIDKISQNEVFGNLNVCLKMKEDSTFIVQIYSYLLRCTSIDDNGSKSINARALNRYIQLYKEISIQTKKSILTFLLNFDVLYKHPFCCDCCPPNLREHFPLDKFCVDDVLTDIECFEVYAKIIEKVIEMKKPEVVEKSFQKILLLIKSVANSDPNSSKYQLPTIFQWFSKILLTYGVTPKFFNDQSFFSDFIINSTNEAAISLIKMPEFYRVLTILINEKRNFHRKYSLFRKMIELAIFQPDIQTSLLSLLSENFGPDIFRFYLKNMDQPKIHDILDPFLPFNTYDFRNLFKLGNCFQIVLRKIDSETFLIDLLKLIFLIVNQNNDHFFDEWVVVQPKDSPLFKLDPSLIREYVLPSNSESPIYIPSLLPLINDYLYEGESPFNFYLIGRFATPVYKKLELTNPYYPILYLYYITDVSYIHPFALNKEENKKFFNLLKEKKENQNFLIPCYEFFPHSPIGYLEITDIPISSISFNIKFSKNSPDSICFMRFSGLSLIFKNGKIFVGNDSPFKVNANQWIKVSVKSKLFSRTEIAVNGTVFTVSKSFQFECLGDNNGLTFISYIIDKKVAINEMEESSAVIKPRGSAASVPIHSISDFFDNYHHFLEVIEIFADNDETRNITFLISLSQYIQPDNLYSFFLEIFQAILRNYDKIGSKDNWITTLIDHINLIENLSTRTYVFCSFLFDIETWTKLTVEQMKTFISYSIFQLDTYELRSDKIFTKYNFLFSLIISHYFDSNKNVDVKITDKDFSLREEFFSLWAIVSSKLSENAVNIINEIVPFAFTIKISSLNFPSDIQEFDIGQVLDDISLINSERTSIISLIFDLEKQYQTSFFNLEQLLEIALTQNIEIAEKAFNKFCERCRFSNSSDVHFASKNIAILSKISQRFSIKISTWIYFTEFLSKQQIENFPIPVEQILLSHLEHPEFLYILYSMLVSLSRNIISMRNDDENDKLLPSLIELRKNAYDFLVSLISSTKVDDSIIFGEQSIAYIYDLMIGGEKFNIENWIIKNEESLKNYFNDSKFASYFSPKLYQSIPLFTPLFTAIYDQDISSNSNLPDEYYETASSFFQKLILMSFNNEKYFLYILEILFIVKNISFIQDNLLYIMLFLMTSNISLEMQDLLRKFFYILSIVRPEVFTTNFINEIFSKCIDWKYFNVISTYITFNDKFNFKIEKYGNETNEKEAQDINENEAQNTNENEAQNTNENEAQNINENEAQNTNKNEAQNINENEAQNTNEDEKNQSEFGPFLSMLENFGSHFIRENLRNASIIAIKLIQKGCNDKRFNDYLNLFATTSNNTNIDADGSSSMNLNDSNSDINEKERRRSSNYDENEFKITPDILQKFVGPTFAHLLCTLHDYSKITADKPLFNNAMNEFKAIYNIIKTQKVDHELFNEFNFYIYSNEQSRNEAEKEKENQNGSTSNPVLTHLASTDLSSSNKVLNSSIKTSLGLPGREDQKSFAKFSFKIVAQSLVSCYQANKYFFNEFNLKLRKKEFDYSLKHFKYSMFKSQQLQISSQYDVDENEYKNFNDRYQYEHKVITKRNGKSYKVSPFISPFHIPATVFPSNFSLITPNDQKQETNQQKEETFIFFKPTFSFSVPFSNEIPDSIFKFSSLYNYPKNQLLYHFEKIYGKVESMMNCILIRLDMRIDSIIMKMNPKMYIILTESSCDFQSNNNIINNINNNNGIFGSKGEINLKKEINRDLCTDFLNGDYGRFSMFCGHFVLIISVDDILLSTQYTSLTNPNSVYVNSITSGSFIIEFVPQEGNGIISNVIAAGFSVVMGNNLDFPSSFSSLSSSTEGKKLLIPINESKARWLSGEISNIEYLLRVNRAAQRSFCDLSSYPIMPRLLKYLNQTEFPFIFEKQKCYKQQNQTNKMLSASVPSFASSLNSDKNQNEAENNENSIMKSASTPTIPKKESKNDDDNNNDNNEENTPQETPQKATTTSLKAMDSSIIKNSLKDSNVLRDLNLPVQISASSDSELDFLRRRSESQNFFYAENVSNPIYVSGVSIRLSPFCRSLWYLNDGWDKGSRNFTSIQSFFGINGKTNYEFTPEAFVGTTFINWNKFVLPNGETLTIKEFPHWSILHNSPHGVINNGNFNNVSNRIKSYSLDVPFKFAELQQFLIETENTREELHSWIDLYFGCKQNSFENYNVFSPLSYMQSKPQENQGPWFLQCGRVPLKIFESLHDIWKPENGPINEKIEESQTQTSSSSLVDALKQNKKQSQQQPQSQIQLSNELESSKSIDLGSSESTSNLSLIQLKDEEIIKYTYRFDLQNVKFDHHYSYQTDQHYMANYLQRIKLNKGYSLLINGQGVTLMQSKSGFLSSRLEKIQNFDSSLVDTTWVDEVHVTRDMQYVALSCFNSTVSVARIIYEGDEIPSKLRPVAQLNIKSIQAETHKVNSHLSTHSAISTSHLICATSHQNKVIVWSISNGRVLWDATFSHTNENKEKNKPTISFDVDEIEKKKEKVDLSDEAFSIGAVEFDDVIDALFVSAGGTLYQMSLSGIVIREIDLGDRITAISCFGFGFSIAERAVVVGQSSGNVKIVSLHLDDDLGEKRKSCDEFEESEYIERYGEFEVSKEMKISSLPIYRIETNDFSYNVSVYDMSCRFPEFLPKSSADEC